MIDVNGVEMRTEAQWAQKYRAVLKRQLEKGVRREWYVPGGKTAEAVFYREDQTRPYNKRELQKAKKKRRQASEYTLWKRRLRRIAKRPAVPCDNPSGIIVFDTETTGLDPGKGRDEILRCFNKTPFLNESLFACLDHLEWMSENENQMTYVDGFSRNNTIQDGSFVCRAFVPNILFFNEDKKHPGLITLLRQYDFVVEENTVEEAVVALDPEVLGMVFENLLA